MKTLAGIDCKAWAMEPVMLSALFESYTKAMSSGLLAQRQSQAPQGRKTYTVNGGIAEIQITGTMLKDDGPWWMDYLGVKHTNMSATAEAIREANKDPSVSSIFLNIDSPGGTVDGTQELADAVASSEKPVRAHASDMMASAAYWVGSQAGFVTAGLSAFVGSVGVYTVLEDTSKAHEQAGVKIHVVRSADLKGAGVNGDQITEEQLSAQQDLIDKTAALFVDYVSSKRKMTPESMAEASSGRVWIASDSKNLGLIDEISTYETARKSTIISNGFLQTAKAESQSAKVEKKKMEQNQDTAELQARVAALESENKALAEAKKLALESQRDTLIEKYRANIAPASLSAVKEYADFCGDNVAKFEGYLKSLQPVTNPERSSSAPQGRELPAPGREIVEAARVFSTTPEKLELSSLVKGIQADGKFLLDNGNVIDAKAALANPKQILKEVADGRID